MIGNEKGLTRGRQEKTTKRSKVGSCQEFIKKIKLY